MKIIEKSIKYLFLFFIIISCLFGLVFLFIKTYDNGKFYNIIFEKTKPIITLLDDNVKGIGNSTQVLRVKLQDEGAGLDAYNVSLNQKNRHIQLESKKLKGEKEKIIEIPLSFRELKLTEGVANVIIKAFDKSFWNNHREVNFNLEVDARFPKLKVITSQHNLLFNGVQLVVYQAHDDNLKRHGVQYGEKFFQGFPINLIDSSIKDNDVYGVFYSILESDNKSFVPVVIAEDNVGNKVEKTFYNKKMKRRVNNYTSSLTSYFAKVISKRLNKNENESYEEFFDRVLRKNQKKESREIFEALHDVIFDTQLTLPFVAQHATVIKNFGSIINYTYEKKDICEKKEEGATFLLFQDEDSVKAISNGTVLFVKKMNYYGNIVAVAHGGSVVALYSMAGEPLVKSGEKVEASQSLLKKGNSGISVLDNEYLLEIRINGYPVNPQEFFDNFWCGEHITGKLNLVKEDLGLITPQFNF